MRIAQVAPLYLAVPPRDYGGTERCIATLVDGLVQSGHDVTLFASGDSRTRARLEAAVPSALGFDSPYDVEAIELAMLTHIYRHAEDFDIIHAHLKYLVLPFTEHVATPTVLTLHGRLDTPGRARIFRTYPHVHHVAISRSQQSFIPDLSWAALIPHGIPVEEFPFSSEPGTYFAFVGRVSAEKRLDWAIAVAEATGIPLKIAARIENEAYFEREIAPHLNPPAIEYLGLLDENSKRHLLCNALALLLPIDWPEPFGLTFIESLACGTPVLTCPRGAATEIIRDGYTGFLCPDVAGLIEASGYINSLSRTACRETVMIHFHSERMVERYEQLYARLRAAGGYE